MSDATYEYKCSECSTIETIKIDAGDDITCRLCQGIAVVTD